MNDKRYMIIEASNLITSNDSVRSQTTSTRWFDDKSTADSYWNAKIIEWTSIKATAEIGSYVRAYYRDRQTHGIIKREEWKV